MSPNEITGAFQFRIFFSILKESICTIIAFIPIIATATTTSSSSLPCATPLKKEDTDNQMTLIEAECLISLEQLF